MEIKNIREIEKAVGFGRSELLRLGIGLLFIIGIMMYIEMSAGGVPGHIMLVVAAVIGGYMAMNIGANDVANNVGPAVGSQALTMTGAIIIAAIFEASGALIAGGDVVGTIKKDIIDPAQIGDQDTFIWLMTAALLAGAVWLNIATYLGAPVSTTHSIVGGVLGAGIAAGGFGIADWNTMGAIAASWVISPVMGGIIAAFFLFIVKRTIMYRKDMKLAAKRMVPILVGLMAWAFSSYLMLKGLKKLWKFDLGDALLYGLAIAIVVYVAVRYWIGQREHMFDNTKSGVNSLFTIPLIFAAALLSFAHGANDVANAVGPLAAINDAIMSGGIAKKASIPVWVMLVGALGIAIGLALYGPKLIRTVGSQITELDKSRAFCVAMAAAITVIIASQLGLPVSSTHIAVGGIFGVGFLREYIKSSYAQMTAEIRHHHEGQDKDAVDSFLEKFEQASVIEKGVMLKELKQTSIRTSITKQERKGLRRVHRMELVKRSSLMRIVLAWVVTVPASALMAALLFYAIRGMLLP
jgi:PiT family inorganic phosphate transporter